MRVNRGIHPKDCASDRHGSTKAPTARQPDRIVGGISPTPTPPSERPFPAPSPTLFPLSQVPSWRFRVNPGRGPNTREPGSDRPSVARPIGPFPMMARSGSWAQHGRRSLVGIVPSCLAGDARQVLSLSLISISSTSIHIHRYMPLRTVRLRMRRGPQVRRLYFPIPSPTLPC